MITGEAMLEELIQLEPSRLDENTQKLFYTIMKVIDERDELQERIGKVNKYLCQLLQEAYLEESSNVDIGLIEYAVDLLKGEPNNE